MEDIKPATPRVPTEKLSSDVAVGRVALRSLTTELGGIPGLSTSASAGILSVGTGAVGMAAGVATGAAAITAMIAGMKTAVDQAVALESSLAAVKSIKLDLDTSAASASLRQLATETGESAGSLAKGLYQLFSSINVPQEQAILLMQKFSQGAIAAQTDSATFGTAIIGVLNAYKLSVADADHISDIFFNTVRDGVVTGQQLAAGLGPITASAKQAGVSLEELGALIVGVTKEGGDAAQNLNNLNNLLQKLVTKETTQSFKELGISVADASGKLHTPIEILGALKVRLADLTEAQKANALQALFPDLQARQGAQVILSQLDQVRASLVANQTEVGSTKTAYQTMAETNAAALERLKQAVASLAVEFGNQLLPAMGAVLTAAGHLVTGLSDAGRAVDAFLADPKTREAAALLIRLQQTAERAAQAPQTPQPPAFGPGSDVGTTQTPVLGQEGGQALGGAVAAFVARGVEQDIGHVGDAFDALGKKLSGLTDAERALIATHRERITEEDALAQRARQLEQDDEEAAKGLQARTAAQAAAAQAAADAAAAVQLTATAQQRLAAGLAAGIGVQADWNAELVKALDPVKNLSGVTSGELIEGILKAKQATEDSAKAFEIHDVAIAAEVIHLRDLAAKATDVAEAQALQQQAGALAAAALDAQARGQAAATETATALAKPLSDLAGSILPALTAQQVAHVKAVEALDGPYAALAAAAQAAGIDIGQFGDLTALTGQQLAEVKKQVDAAAKGIQGFLTEEDRSRFASVLGTLASSTDAGTAAQAKMLEAAGKTDEALQLLLQHAGAAPGAIGALKQALLDGGAAAVDAREKIAALTAFVRDSAGTVRLKVDVDIENAQAALGKLQQDFQAANTKRAETESKATHEFNVQQAAVAQAQSKAGADYKDSVLAISQARTDSTAQLGSDLAKASAASNKAMGDVSAAARKVQTDLTAAVSDASANLGLAFATAHKTFTDGVKGLQEQAATAIQSAAAAAASGLQALSAAMTTFNQQQVQNAFQASVALQDATNQANGFTDFTSVQSALRTKQIQEAGAAGIAQQNQANQLAQAQHSVAQQQLDATKALSKTMEDLAKQTQQLVDTEKQAQTAARVTAANALTAANRAAGIAAIGQTAFDATHVAGKALVMINGQPFLVDTDTLRQGPPDLQAGGLAGAAREAAQATSKGLSDAFDQSNKRQRALDEQAAKEQQTRFDQLIKEAVERGQDPEGKFRTAQERAFDDAEKARRKEQADADKQFREQKKNLDAQLAALEAIKTRLDRPNVTANVTAVQETGKDLLTKAAQVAAQRLRL